MTPASSMTLGGFVPFRLRRDIKARRIDLGKNADWVIQDPLSRNFFYFSDAEYCILKLLDGKRRWTELLFDVSRRLTPQFIELESLARFIADAKSKGLVESIEPVGGNASAAIVRPSAAARNEAPWWHQPLAIRLPGIYPDQYLQRCFGNQSWLANVGISASVFWVSMAILWLIAGLVAISHIDSLVTELNLLAIAPPARQLLLFFICIGLTKILHELGHAVACKLLGGECREIGVMFLMAVPCLYCDVSDAWMMPSRWKRMLISAAGMIVEISLAAVAMIAWAVMTPGPWRDAALMVAVIGSVNTVLINGNPLLRYDGYFIFSDWVRVPNLGYEAIETLRHVVRRLVWGRGRIDGESVGDQSRPASTRFLASYAVASAVYRYVMLTAIVYAIYRVTASQGLAWMAIAAAIFIFGRNQIHWWRSIGKVPLDDGMTNTSRYRWVVIRGLFVALIAWAWFTPFNRSVTVPIEIRSAGQQDLYVTTSGRIESAMSAGAKVKPGDIVLQLVNESATRDLMSLETDRRALVAKVEALKLRHSGQRNLSAEIAAIESAIESLDQRVKWQLEQIERLSIRSPSAGVVYSPPTRPAPRLDTATDHTAEVWSGSPLAVENVGAWLEVGTLVGTIGHEHKREAILMVAQSQIEWVRQGQRVELLRGDVEPGMREGIVRDVTFVGAMEESFTVASTENNGNSAVSRDASARTYRVLVEMIGDQNDRLAGRKALPVRGVGMAKITVEPMSMHQRLRQLLSQMFAVP